MMSPTTWIDTSPAGTTAIPAGRSTVLPPLEGDGAGSVARPRFEIVGLLGEGGLGRVVEADDLDIGRRVAIKTIRPDCMSDAALIRFAREVRIGGKLDHPNIVPIHDVGRAEDGGLYFVMKRVEGETIEDIITRLREGDPAAHARWTFERRVAVFRQVLHAVAFAHAKGVLHRDLKPANVMVGRHGEVQLLDWGVARSVDGPEGPAVPITTPKTLAGSVIGTPMYMAPEQARGEPADERSDVWSLSVLFYELLTLRHFLPASADIPSVLAAVQTAPIPNPTTLRVPGQPPVPAELAWYVLAGLQRDPAQRMQSVRAMIERLDRRDEGEFPVQCPITFQKRMLGSWLRAIDRHPALSIVAIAGGAMAMIALMLTTVVVTQL